MLKAARQARERSCSRSPAKELEIDPADLEIVDGEVVAKGAPQKKISVPDVAAAATWTYGELITGTGAQLNPYAAIVEPDTGKVDLPPHAAISYAACAAEVEVDDETGEVRVEQLWQCFDVGRAINPTLVEGQIEGGAMMGLGLAVLEECYPYYPSVEHRGAEFGSYLAPGIEGLPEVNTIIIENPSADGPYGAKGISEMANNPQPPAIAAAVYDAVGVWVTELPITPERVLRALQGPAPAAARGQGRDLRRGPFGQHTLGRGLPLPLRDPRLARERQRSSFGTWNGVPLHEFVSGVNIHAVGGEQVLICRVNYDPGFGVGTHSHEHTEQVMVVTEGELELTVAGQGMRTLGVGDWAVINRGVEHSVRTANGAQFIEALAPVPLDHVPNRDRDLVLGPDGGAGHVEH